MPSQTREQLQTAVSRLEALEKPKSRPRQLNQGESWSFYYFEKHARQCRACLNPLDVYQSGRLLCETGYSLAQDVAEHVFEHDGVVYSRIKVNHKAVPIEIPHDFDQTAQLLRAKERHPGRLGRPKPLISSKPTAPGCPPSDEHSREYMLVEPAVNGNNESSRRRSKHKSVVVIEDDEQQQPAPAAKTQRERRGSLYYDHLNLRQKAAYWDDIRLPAHAERRPRGYCTGVDRITARDDSGRLGRLEIPKSISPESRGNIDQRRGVAPPSDMHSPLGAIPIDQGYSPQSSPQSLSQRKFLTSPSQPDPQFVNSGQFVPLTQSHETPRVRVLTRPITPQRSRSTTARRIRQTEGEIEGLTGSIQESRGEVDRRHVENEALNAGRSSHVGQDNELVQSGINRNHYKRGDQLSRAKHPNMSLAEKMLLWSSDSEAHGLDDCNAQSQDIANNNAVSGNSIDCSIDHINARDFILQGEEYSWRLDRLDFMTSMDYLGEGSPYMVTRRKIMDFFTSEPLRLSFSQPRGTLNVQWDPAAFMRYQYAENSKQGSKSLRHVITLCGTTDQAQAYTCEEYVRQIWPGVGLEFLDCIDAALASAGDGICISIGGCTLHLTLKSGWTVLATSGALATCIELAEVATWLCVACRASSDRTKLELQSAKLAVDPEGASGPCLTVRSEPLRMNAGSTTSATCWHAMFRNPVIVSQYPISRRHDNEQGLEISLGMMATLSQAQSAVIFAGRCLLKGYNSMLVPTKRTDSSVQWHLLVDKQGERLSSVEGWQMAKVNSFADAFFEGARHFVGWAAKVEGIAGTASANIHDIGFSVGTKPPGPGVYLEPATTISLGSFTKFVPLSLKIQRGRKDTPEYLQPGKYPQMIDHAMRWKVLLSDTRFRRHWLIDGASALLHLIRAWLSPVHSDDPPENVSAQLRYATGPLASKNAHATLKDVHNRKLVLGEASFEAKRVAKGKDGRALEDSGMEYTTTYWCLQDQIEHFWRMLEQIHDGTELRRQSPQQGIDLDLRNRILMGFEFKDLVRGTSPIEPLEFKLREGASDWFTLSRRIGTINIFASELGELFKPIQPDAAPRGLCVARTGMPTGHDYLAMPLCLLASIVDKATAHTQTCVQLPGGLYWRNAQATFAPCNCPGKPSTRCTAIITKLHGMPVTRVSKDRPRISTHPVFQDHPAGAILLGHIAATLRVPQHTKADRPGISIPRLRMQARRPSIGSDIDLDHSASQSASSKQSPPRTSGSNSAFTGSSNTSLSLTASGFSATDPDGEAAESGVIVGTDRATAGRSAPSLDGPSMRPKPLASPRKPVTSTPQFSRSRGLEYGKLASRWNLTKKFRSTGDSGKLRTSSLGKDREASGADGVKEAI